MTARNSVLIATHKKVHIEHTVSLRLCADHAWPMLQRYNISNTGLHFYQVGLVCLISVCGDQNNVYYRGLQAQREILVSLSHYNHHIAFTFCSCS